MGRPKGSKNSKKKKRSTEDDDNILDPKRDPDVTYALREGAPRTLADSMRDAKSLSPISDEEIAKLLAKPDWIWGGMTETVMRIFTRLKKTKGVSPLE